MPTYEYRCPSGHEFELFQSMSEEPRTACPECGEIAKRLLSGGAGLIFKGEGFYITDNRSDAYKKAATSDKEAASPEKSSGDDAGKKSSEGSGSSGPGRGSTDGGSSRSKATSPGSSDASGGSKSSRVDKSSSSDS